MNRVLGRVQLIRAEERLQAIVVAVNLRDRPVRPAVVRNLGKAGGAEGLVGFRCRPQVPVA